MYPPVPDCLDCENYGGCVCWSEADEREFEHEMQEVLDMLDAIIIAQCFDNEWPKGPTIK